MALLEQLTGVLPGHELGRDGHKGVPAPGSVGDIRITRLRGRNGFPEQRMLLRHDQDHLFPGDGNIVEVGPLAVVADEDDIQLLVFQQLVQRGAGVLGEDEIQVRVSLDKGRDDIMKKKIGAAVGDADADDAFIVLAQ